MCLCLSKANFYKEYTKGELISETKFSKVYNCKKDENKINLVVKIQNPLKNNNDIKNEIQILRYLNKNKGICNLIYSEYKITSSYLVFEKINGPILSEYYKNDISINEKLNLTNQLIDVFTYIQNKNIIHRDIKNDNIMIELRDKIPVVKLIDFGLSVYQKNLLDYNSNIPSGTYGYMCPEMLSYIYYNANCDTWSLAVLIYHLFCLEYPYKINLKNISNYQTYHITGDKIIPEINYDIITDKNIQNLLKKMFIIDKEMRPLIKDIKLD